MTDCGVTHHACGCFLQRMAEAELVRDQLRETVEGLESKIAQLREMIVKSGVPACFLP